VHVSYANKWQKRRTSSAKSLLDCYLTEELKWSKPWFTFQKKDVAIIILPRDSCALALLKGVLLRDQRGIPERAGERA
jgi:uncharacterized protein YdeI (YjbR/CyaY-like superfamily)